MAAMLWWFSFTCVIIFVLLNFLIAIIVDAFMEIKVLHDACCSRQVLYGSSSQALVCAPQNTCTALEHVQCGTGPKQSMAARFHFPLWRCHSPHGRPDTSVQYSAVLYCTALH